MIRTITRPFLLAALTIGLFAQAPQSGTIEANTYTNPFFHLIAKLPHGWTLQSTPPSVPNAETFELFRAHSPTGESFSASAQEVFKRADSDVDLAKYLDSLGKTMQPKGWEPEGEGTSRGYGGLLFAEQNFIVTTVGTKYYTSIAVTKSHGHVVRFSLTATSPDSLAELAKTVTESVTFLPDFGQPPDPPPSSPPARPLRIRISSGVAAGNLVHKEQPSYPLTAKNERAQGAVVLQCTIGTDGQIKRIYALEGHPLLTEAAIDAVKQWRYKPYLLNGQVVEVSTTINVIFTLSR